MWKLITFAAVVFGACSIVSGKCNETCGVNGVCRDDTCVCDEGWQGPNCQFCGGKIRLGASTGTIHDGIGNYSLNNKCSWLIDAPNSTITLHIEEFTTECGWDYLYVFDGDSVDSPLLAAFSGLMYKDAYSVRRIPEVVAKSGQALIHFFSDAAYNMSGFNVTYRLNACPSMTSAVDCSGNGVCADGTCTCNSGWNGVACHIENCPDNCGAAEGKGVCDPITGCSCLGNYIGADCSQVTRDGYWETVPVQGVIPPGSASHGAVVWKDSMYIIAGESSRRSLLYAYNFNSNVWETPYTTGDLTKRYGHSTVQYDGKIFVYGGALEGQSPTSELWAFDLESKKWENVTVRTASCNVNYITCGPLKSTGHTATLLINETDKRATRMIVIFGYSPIFGHLNTVQEYYFDTGEWHVIDTKGYPVKGGYGHSASWDALTGKIYVYGGVILINKIEKPSKNMYSYDPNERTWTLLTDAPSARFLHTSTFISEGLMLVFGGRMSPDTKCYSSELLAYDVLCDSWDTLPVPNGLDADLPRFGHSSVLFEGALYIYGGFDGQMLSDILKHTPGDCQFNNEIACLSTKRGVKCVWISTTNSCSSISLISKDVVLSKEETHINRCPKLSTFYSTQREMQKACEVMEDCRSCVQTTNGCVWCGSSCTSNEKCSQMIDNFVSVISNVDHCPTSICNRLDNFKTCTSQPICRWRLNHADCISHHVESYFTVAIEPTCSQHDSCQKCNAANCLWCHNEGRCIDQNAYISSFPYGQCRDWQTTPNEVSCPNISNEISLCSFYQTPDTCRDDPACGWCNDVSMTGLGTCMPGGYKGPTPHNYTASFHTCPPERWYFTASPLCQCNGHASCVANTSSCMPCNNFTTGSHCQYCKKGYWGSPVNGGKCTKCRCHGRAKECHKDTGTCYCTTKGAIGNKCKKCDTYNHYYMDDNSKSCVYDLVTNYQFTFNLSKKEDVRYSRINFRNTPIRTDVDTLVSIMCSFPATINITMRQEHSHEETPLHTNIFCIHIRSFILKPNLGMEDNITLPITFYVRIYDNQPPMLLIIAFKQDLI